jgi:putative hydrolase of the HAD superfamily
VLIIFDLDNTLIDRDAAFVACLDQFLKKYNLVLSSDQMQKIIKKDDSGRYERAQFCRFLTRFLPELTLTEEQVWTEFQQLPAFVQPNDTINRVLMALSKQHTLCLLSNGSGTMQRAKLHNAQLPQIFDHVFISGEMGISKPDPRIFTAVLKHYQVKPIDCVMIGDDLVRDIEPAKAMGLHTIWIEAFMAERMQQIPSHNRAQNNLSSHFSSHLPSHFRAGNALDLEEHIIQCGI